MALSFRTQQRLAALVQAIAEAEKKTEVTRQVLAEQRQFEPHTAFKRLDLTRDGYISSSELIEFLNVNNILATTKEQLALFAGLDFNDDGLISYSDFVNTVLPQEDEKLRSLCSLREGYYLEPSQKLPYEVEWGLTRIFEQEIKNYRNIENLKDILSTSFDFNNLDAFNTLDEEQLGYIDYESIDKFQRNAGKILSQDEILAFLRVVGENGRVTYSQFCNAVGAPRQVSSLSPSKLERVSSPVRSKDFYLQELQGQLDRSIIKTKNDLLNSQIQEQQERLDRSIDLQRSQQKLDRLERELDRQRSQDKIENLERSIRKQRSQERLNDLQRSVERQRSIEKLNRSIDLQKSINKMERDIERQRSQERINEINRSIELQRSRERLDRSIELQKSQQKFERELEIQRSQRKIDELNRSIERSRVQEELNRSIERSRVQDELNRSIERTRAQERLNRSIERSRAQERLNRSIELQRSQERLNRSIERSRQIQLEADLARSQRKQESQQLELELELQKSISKSRRLESEILDASLKGSQYNTPSRNRSIADEVSPMKGNEEQQLVKSLKEQINIDREIEEIKKQLALKVDFNLLDAFRVFDSKARGYVTKLEFELALNDIQIFPTKDEMYLLFKRYDTDNDGLLRYSEFTKICLPQSQEYSQIMSNRAPHYLDSSNGIDTFEYETRFVFKKLLNRAIAAEVDAEALRQRLARRPLFSSTDAFNAIDANERGFISIDQFKNILNNWGFFVTSSDLVTLVNRYDKNQDGKVSYGEFLSEITPKSPLKY